VSKRGFEVGFPQAIRLFSGIWYNYISGATDFGLSATAKDFSNKKT
jgi:hypothetical protein